MVAGLPTNGTTASPLVFQISDSVRLKKFKQMSPLRASLTETVSGEVPNSSYRTMAPKRMTRTHTAEHFVSRPSTLTDGTFFSFLDHHNKI